LVYTLSFYFSFLSLKEHSLAWHICIAWPLLTPVFFPTLNIQHVIGFLPLLL
jgi:hypothetical protein